MPTQTRTNVLPIEGNNGFSVTEKPNRPSPIQHLTPGFLDSATGGKELVLYPMIEGGDPGVSDSAPISPDSNPNESRKQGFPSVFASDKRAFERALAAELRAWDELPDLPCRNPAKCSGTARPTGPFAGGVAYYCMKCGWIFIAKAAQ